MPCSLYLASLGVDFGPPDVSALLPSLFDFALLASRSTLSTAVLSYVFSSTLVIRSADGPVHASSVLRVTGHWVLVSGDTERRGLT